MSATWITSARCETRSRSKSNRLLILILRVTEQVEFLQDAKWTGAIGLTLECEPRQSFDVYDAAWNSRAISSSSGQVRLAGIAFGLAAAHPTAQFDVVANEVWRDLLLSGRRENRDAAGERVSVSGCCQK